jgi:hypothetical protein
VQTGSITEQKIGCLKCVPRGIMFWYYSSFVSDVSTLWQKPYCWSQRVPHGPNYFRYNSMKEEIKHIAHIKLVSFPKIKVNWPSKEKVCMWKEINDINIKIPGGFHLIKVITPHLWLLLWYVRHMLLTKIYKNTKYYSLVLWGSSGSKKKWNMVCFMGLLFVDLYLIVR